MINKIKYKMPKRRENKLLELLGNLEGKKILDLGCASGYFARELEKRGAFVTGIDISHESIDQAKSKISNAIVHDLDKIKTPFNKNHFDVIIASEVLEHLRKPSENLKELHRILKYDGYLIITTPNLMYWGNRINFLRGKFKYEKIGIFDETHIHFYTYSTLVEDIAKAGFYIDLENNIYTGPSFLKYIKRHFPAIFAYQFVITCKKK